MLQIKSFQGGYDDNFCYLLYDDETKEAVIIDISIKPEIVFKFIKERGLDLKFVVVMHSHFDHLNGFSYYQEQEIKIAGSELLKKEVDLKLKDGDELSLGEFKLKVLATPGHLFDCICILVDGNLFTSDTLFIDGCGRCDLVGADSKEMKKSLEKIKSLPDKTMIYPGHNYGPVPYATLGEQKITNRYLQDAI